MATNFKILQNGSDIRGISLTGVPGELPNLTPDEAKILSQGFLLWLSKKSGKRPCDLKIAVGRDPRLSGQLIKHGVISGFGPFGATVLDCGIASTPAMFMSTVFPQFNCDGAIMITASHLPYNRNGFKYFDKEGGLQKSDITQIIKYAEDGVKELGKPTHPDAHFHVLGKISWPSQEADLMSVYCEHLRNIIKEDVGGEKPLSGLKICVDAGNGSGGFFANDILKPLGADISSSQYLSPDGGFPNHMPNPEDQKAMTDICTTVLSTGSDLGLIFDTDVDRSSAVDSKGTPIARNRIVALAASLIADNHPGSTVVTDSITSDELTVFLEKDLGLKHFRYKRGYKNVINKAMEIDDAYLAIETSGHAALKENYFLDDGAYLATKIVIKAANLAKEGKTISSLLAGLSSPAESKEFRMAINAEDFGEYGDNILKDLEVYADNNRNMSVVSPNYEGVRINFNSGWCLLRKSLHDPIMPLNIESTVKGGVEEITKELLLFLKNYKELDTSKL